MRFRFAAVLVAATLVSFASIADAQPGGGRRPGGPGGGFFGGGGSGGGFGLSRLALLRIEAVQKELELTDEQIESINKLIEESRSSIFGGRGGGDQPRGNRGPGFRRPGGDRGEGNRGEGNRGERPRRPSGDDAAAQFAPSEYFVQQGDDEEEQPRRRFQDLSEEERQKLIEDFRKQREERQKKQNDELNKVLLPHQVKRLDEILLQLQGVGALSNPDVAKELKITEKQQKEISDVRSTASESFRSEMRALFESGNREGFGEKFAEFRKELEGKVLGVLSSQQQKEFEKMKGKPFKLPEGALRGSFGGGRGGPGGGPDAGRRRGEGQPQRPDDA